MDKAPYTGTVKQVVYGINKIIPEIAGNAPATIYKSVELTNFLIIRFYRSNRKFNFLTWENIAETFFV